jgi:hypothetical protein
VIVINGDGVSGVDCAEADGDGLAVARAGDALGSGADSSAATLEEGPTTCVGVGGFAVHETADKAARKISGKRGIAPF